MSANLPPQMLAIKDWLMGASRQLANVDISNPTLDTELILAHALSKNRTYLHAHPEQLIDSYTKKSADKMLEKRLNRMPVAYITGTKEFYGRRFIVTPSVLIPRPESETIIDLLKQILATNLSTSNPQLIDIGTGSGCLGITAKLEFPFFDVTLSDISEKALSIARLNAKNHKAMVDILKSDLLQKYKNKPDIIVANLPYVDAKWKRSPETNFEPDLALFANNHGLSIVRKIIVQASKIQNTGNYLIIEADPIQHKSLIEYAKKYHFKKEYLENYVIGFKKLKN